MAYTYTNYKTKKALLLDFKAGKSIQCFQPGPFPLAAPGRISLEGPHYPASHSWYASAEVDSNGIILKVK